MCISVLIGNVIVRYYFDNDFFFGWMIDILNWVWVLMVEISFIFLYVLRGNLSFFVKV